MIFFKREINPRGKFKGWFFLFLLLYCLKKKNFSFISAIKDERRWMLMMQGTRKELDESRCRISVRSNDLFWSLTNEYIYIYIFYTSILVSRCVEYENVSMYVWNIIGELKSLCIGVTFDGDFHSVVIREEWGMKKVGGDGVGETRGKMKKLFDYNSRSRWQLARD